MTVSGQPPIVVSACLAGIPCRYDGRALPAPDVVGLVERGEAVPVCAELLGGLSTPRPPAEIVGGDGEDVLAGKARVVTVDGDDVTQAFVRGAQAVVEVAAQSGATRAILQPRSPSCGCSQVHDGSHTGELRSGIGVTAAALRQHGIVTEDHERCDSATTRGGTATPSDSGSDGRQVPSGPGGGVPRSRE